MNYSEGMKLVKEERLRLEAEEQKFLARLGLARAWFEQGLEEGIVSSHEWEEAVYEVIPELLPLDLQAPFQLALSRHNRLRRLWRAAVAEAQGRLEAITAKADKEKEELL